jgi:hypothetical protein
MTDGIVTFDSELGHPRIIPAFQGRGPQRSRLRQTVLVADNT